MARRSLRPALNNLWSIWYCFIVTGIEIYIAYHLVDVWHDYNRRSWTPHPKPVDCLSLYLAIVIVAVLLLPLFFFTACYKVGNFPHDGVKLGRDVSLRQYLQESNSRPSGRSLWRFSVPFAATVHILTAFLFLLPELLIRGKELQYRMVPADEALRTPFDLVFGPPPLRTRIIHGPTGNLTRHVDELPSREFSIEFVNYALALFVFSIRYPSVFWKTSKPYSVFFSVHLVVVAAQSLFAFSGFGLLYKLRCFLEKREQHDHLVLYSDVVFLQSPLAVVLLYAVSQLLVFLSAVVLVYYGMSHFRRTAHQVASKYKKYLTNSIQLHLAGANRSECSVYRPHMAALFILIALAASKGPLIHDYTIIYQQLLDVVLLACLIAEVVFLLFWIFLWLLLTIKSEWHFSLQFEVCQIPAWNHPVTDGQPLDRVSDVFATNSSRRISNGCVVRETDIVASTDTPDSFSQQGDGEQLLQQQLITPEDKGAAVDAEIHLLSGDVLVRSSIRTSSVRQVKQRLRKNGAAKVTFSDDAPGTPPNGADSVKTTDSELKKILDQVNRISGDSGSVSELLFHSPPAGGKLSEDKEMAMYVPKVIRISSPKAEMDATLLGPLTKDAPDGTLNRQYRNSIRDTIGNYFTLNPDTNTTSIKRASYTNGFGPRSPILTIGRESIVPLSTFHSSPVGHSSVDEQMMLKARDPANNSPNSSGASFSSDTPTQSNQSAAGTPPPKNKLERRDSANYSMSTSSNESDQLCSQV